MKDFKHLKYLSATKSMKAINQLSPAAYPGNHCPMHTSLAIATRIKGVSTLVIGASECGYYSRGLPESSDYKEDAIHWSYLLDENEVIFGCRQGIVDAVKEMDKEGAKVILLISTCVPEVIGEDLEGIVFEVEKQVSAKVLSVGLGNFKCGSQQPGFWRTLLAFSSLISERPQKKNVINIMGRSKKEEHIPKSMLINILEENYEIRYLAPDSSIDDFKLANEAVVNIVLSPFLEPLAEFLENEYNIPYFQAHSTYEVEEIKDMYEKLFGILEVEVDSRLLENYELAKELQTEVIELVKGVTYVGAKIMGSQPLPLHRYLSKIGMNPLMVHIEDFYPSDKVWREKLLEENQDPILCMMVNDNSDREYILSLEPELIIGDWAGRIEFREKTIQVVDIYGQCGFELTIKLLNKLKMAKKG